MDIHSTSNLRLFRVFILIGHIKEIKQITAIVDLCFSFAWLLHSLLILLSISHFLLYFIEYCHRLAPRLAAFDEASRGELRGDCNREGGNGRGARSLLGADMTM